MVDKTAFLGALAGLVGGLAIAASQNVVPNYAGPEIREEQVVVLTNAPTEEIVTEPTEEVLTEPVKEIVIEPVEEVLIEPTEEVMAEPTEEVLTEPVEAIAVMAELVDESPQPTHQTIHRDTMPTGRTYGGLSEGDVLYDTVQSHYCACSACNGSHSDGASTATASGVRLWNGMDNPYLVACNWLPLNSVIEIGGKEYVVGDTGGNGRLNNVGTVDVFVPGGHYESQQKGLKYDEPMKIVRIGA